MQIVVALYHQSEFVVVQNLFNGKYLLLLVPHRARDLRLLQCALNVIAHYNYNYILIGRP